MYPANIHGRIRRRPADSTFAGASRFRQHLGPVENRKKQMTRIRHRTSKAVTGQNPSESKVVYAHPVDWAALARKAEFRPRQLASLFEISQRQLQRMFRQQFNCTPRGWLRSLQCQLAKDLISKGYSNKAVAYDLRFASESHFCREFKREHGLTPREFARDHLRRVLVAALESDRV